MSTQDLEGQARKRRRKPRIFGLKEAVVFGALMLLCLAYMVLMNERTPPEALSLAQ